MLVKSEIIKTNTSEIWIDEHDVLRVKVMEGAEIDIKEVQICFETYRELGCGPTNKMLQLIDARVESTMTKEGREYVSKHGKDFFIAAAVVTNNFTVRLITNFIIKFYKLDVPIKIFATEEEAFEWLFGYKK